MISDLNQLNPIQAINSDICIIGGGAAGITIALEFDSQGHDVCLLESGGLEFEMASQELNSGEVRGFPQPALIATRLRYLGGTTNHWNGNIWPFFEDDFHPRSWMPKSGWPITLEQLQPYYDKACKVVELKGPNQWTPEALKEFISPIFTSSHLSDNDNLAAAVSQHSAPTRFGKVYRDALQNSGNINLILHANVTHIDTTPDGQHVTAVQIKSVQGKQGRVKAKYYILATGGIENARVLLASNQIVKTGIGNHHDLVGRYFADHLLSKKSGQAVTVGEENSCVAPRRGRGLGIKGYVTFTPGLLEKEKLPRSVFSLSSVKQSGSLSKEAKIIGKMVLESKNECASFSAITDIASAFVQGDDHDLAQVTHLMEPIPYAESRVTLIQDQKDALGIPKAQLNWQLAPEQESAIDRSWQLFAERFAGSGMGRIKRCELSNFDNPSEFDYETSFHHMCTTRMHESPQSGVVDKDCKVHGVDNLFIAGSSVFNTASVPNPTLTIVALAIRLADHLKSLQA